MPFPLEDGANAAAGVRIDSASRIVVGGTYRRTRDGHSGCIVLRLLPGGSLDVSFGLSGMQIITFPGEDCTIEGLTLDANDGIIATGSRVSGSTATVALLRFQESGTLDPSFGDHGVSLVDGFNGFGRALVLDSLGRMVVAAINVVGTPPNDAYHFTTLRLTSTGASDPEFGTAGVAEAAFPAPGEFATSVAVQGDDKPIVAGFVGALGVARYDTEGALDDSFGLDGTRTLSPGSTATRALVDPGGRIVLIGTGDASGDGFGYFARLDADGHLDATFGTAGELSERLPGQALYLSSGTLSTNNAGIYAAGWSYDSSMQGSATLMRITLDGLMDTTFGASGVTQLTPTTTWNAFLDVAEQPDGKIVAVGQNLDPTRTTWIVARFCP